MGSIVMMVGFLGFTLSALWDLRPWKKAGETTGRIVPLHVLLCAGLVLGGLALAIAGF